MYHQILNNHQSKLNIRYFSLLKRLFIGKMSRKVYDKKGETVTIHAVEGKHTATIILMHGLGDTASGWESAAEMLSDQLPHVKFILPTAPTRPITLNMGMPMPGWYDIKTLGDTDNNSKLHDPCDGIDTSRSYILELLEKEHLGSGASDSTSIPYSRMMLAGFSQGGALGLYTGLQVCFCHT